MARDPTPAQSRRKNRRRRALRRQATLVRECQEEKIWQPQIRLQPAPPQRRWFREESRLTTIRRLALCASLLMPLIHRLANALSPIDFPLLRWVERIPRLINFEIILRQLHPICLMHIDPCPPNKPAQRRRGFR